MPLSGLTSHCSSCLCSHLTASSTSREIFVPIAHSLPQANRILTARRLTHAVLFPASPKRSSSCRCRALPSAKRTLVTREEYKTFTNISGLTLKPIADDVWAADRCFRWNGIDVGSRMTVLRLSDGGLWIHSPVELDNILAAALDELGPVKHIVTPNYEHTKYARQWIDHYPHAQSYACPGLQQRADVRFTTEVGTSEGTMEWLSGEVQATWLSYEANPFNGTPFFNEVVFFFRPARLLITADLFWNYPQHDAPLGTALWKLGMDRIYLPFYNRFMIKDKGGFDVQMDRIFREWDFDAILPCHGDYVPRDGKAVLMKHLGLSA